MKLLFKNKGFIVMTGIISLAALTRFYALGKESVLVDEALLVVTQPLIGHNSFFPPLGFLKNWMEGGWLPLYPLLMFFWQKVFGKSDIALRIPSVLFGTATVGIIYFLGKRIFNRYVGFLASCLLAVSTVHLFFSQTATPYVMGAFLISSAFLLFYQAAFYNTCILWISYAVMLFCVLLSNFSVFPATVSLIVFGMVIVCAQQKDKSVKRRYVFFTIGVCAVYGIAIGPLLLHSLHHPGVWTSLPSWKDIFHIFIYLSGKPYQAISSQFQSLPMGFSLLVYSYVAILLFFCIVASVRIVRSLVEEKNRWRSFFICWLIVGIMAPAMLSFIVRPLFGPVRYFLHILIPYYLLASYGIYTCSQKIRFILIGFICILSVTSLSVYYSIEKKHDWRQVIRFLEKNVGVHEEIVFPLNNFIPQSFAEPIELLYYGTFPFKGIITQKYLQDVDPHWFTVLNRSTHSRFQWSTVQGLEAQGLWLVMCEVMPREKAEQMRVLRVEVQQKISQKYTLEQDWSFTDIRLEHYRRK